MTATSSGIPITVSRIITKFKAEKNVDETSAAVTAGILSTLIVAIPLTVLTLAKSKAVAFLFSDQRCLSLLSIMIPGLIFTSVYAVLRGSFWGNGRFMTYSVIEFAEEGVMTIIGIIAVSLATDSMQGTRYAAYAVLLSYLFSFFASVTFFLIHGGRIKNPKRHLKGLLASSTPITAMRTSASLVNTLIAVLLPARLIRYGMKSSLAVSEFGKIYGMAFPLISMPSTIVGSLALVIVPQLSSDYYSHNFSALKNNVERAIKFSVFAACLAIPVFLSLGEEIGEFLYADATAGAYVAKAAVSMLPLSVSLISTSVLNSLGKEKTTLVYFAIGAMSMIACIYFLPKYIGVNSLIVGTFVNYCTTAILNTVTLKKSSPQKINLLWYVVKAITFVVPSAAIGLFSKNVLFPILPDVLALIICCALSGGFQLTLFVVFDMSEFKDGYKYFRKPFTLKSKGTTAKTNA